MKAFNGGFLAGNFCFCFNGSFKEKNSETQKLVKKLIKELIQKKIIPMRLYLPIISDLQIKNKYSNFNGLFKNKLDDSTNMELRQQADQSTTNLSY